MASRFSTDKGGAGVAGLFGLSLVGASMGGRAFVCGWAALWAAAVVWIADAGQAKSRRVVAAILAAAFPICVFFAGQGGVLLASAAAPVILLSSYVIGGLKPEVVESVGVSSFHVLLVGLGLSMVVAVESLSEGHLLIFALLLILALGSAPYMIWANAPTWRAAVAGFVASEIGAAASLLFLGPPVTAGPLLFVGLLTALAAAAGRASGALTRIQPLLNAFLFAAPSFYFGFKFFLT